MNKKLIQTIIRIQKYDYSREENPNKFIQDQNFFSKNIGEGTRILLDKDICNKYDIAGFKTQ